MKGLQRFSTQYKGLEDRILLVGETGDGETESLWLTQRLLLRIVPVLLEWVQKHAPLDLKVASNRAQASDMARVFSTKPVQPRSRSTNTDIDVNATGSIDKSNRPEETSEPISEAILVHSINLSLTSKQVQLRFQNGDEILATLSLQGAPLRQWLVVLHVLWKKSNWHGEIWPDWIRENSKIASNETKSLH